MESDGTIPARGPGALRGREGYSLNAARAVKYTRDCFHRVSHGSIDAVRIPRTARARHEPRPVSHSDEHTREQIVNAEHPRPNTQVFSVETLTIELDQPPNVALLNLRHFALKSKPPEL